MATLRGLATAAAAAASGAAAGIPPPPLSTASRLRFAPAATSPVTFVLVSSFAASTTEGVCSAASRPPTATADVDVAAHTAVAADGAVPFVKLVCFVDENGGGIRYQSQTKV